MHRLKLNFICPTLGVHFKTAALIEVDCQLSVLFCFYRNPDFCVSSPDIFGDYLSFLIGCRITVFCLSGMDFLGSDK